MPPNIIPGPTQYFAAARNPSTGLNSQSGYQPTFSEPEPEFFERNWEFWNLAVEELEQGPQYYKRPLEAQYQQPMSSLASLRSQNSQYTNLRPDNLDFEPSTLESVLSHGQQSSMLGYANPVHLYFAPSTLQPGNTNCASLGFSSSTPQPAASHAYGQQCPAPLDIATLKLQPEPSHGDHPQQPSMPQNTNPAHLNPNFELSEPLGIELQQNQRAQLISQQYPPIPPLTRKRKRNCNRRFPESFKRRIVDFLMGYTEVVDSLEVGSDGIARPVVHLRRPTFREAAKVFIFEGRPVPISTISRWMRNYNLGNEEEGDEDGGGRIQGSFEFMPDLPKLRGKMPEGGHRIKNPSSG